MDEKNMSNVLICYIYIQFTTLHYVQTTLFDIDIIK